MPVDWGCGYGVRHIQVILLFTCGMLEASMLQAMKISVYLINSDKADNYTLFDDPYRQVIRHFSQEEKSILLNGWLVLGFTGSLLGAYLTLFINLKYLLLIIIFLVTLLTYILPQTVVSTNYDLVLMVTLMIGFIHGMKDPVTVALLARWIPHSELGRSVSLVFSSPVLCFVVGITIFSFLKSSPSSWTSVFYLLGNSGVLWCVSWYAFGSPDPNKCFYISAKEKIMLNKNLIIPETNKKITVPWPQLFKSVPFYGLLISKSLSTWIFKLLFYTHFFQSYLFARGYAYDVKLYSIVVFTLITIPLVQFFVGTIGDSIVASKKYPSRYVRKTFNSIALWGQCVCCFLFSYNTPVVCDATFFTLFNHLGCMTFQGSVCTFFDVDRRLSGFIFGLVNFIAMIPLAFVCNYSIPILDAIHINDFESQYKPHFSTVFLTGAICLFFGNFFYIIMASDETDPMLPQPEDVQAAAKK